MLNRGGVLRYCVSDYLRVMTQNVLCAVLELENPVQADMPRHFRGTAVLSIPAFTHFAFIGRSNPGRDPEYRSRDGRAPADDSNRGFVEDNAYPD